MYFMAAPGFLIWLTAVIHIKYNINWNACRLVHEGISDLHCMSDEYLAEELELEYREKNESQQNQRM